MFVFFKRKGAKAQSSKEKVHDSVLPSCIFLIDFLRNYICLQKSPFLASLLLNFSTICTHMLSKFINKPAQKASILSSKANYARSLMNVIYKYFRAFELIFISSLGKFFGHGLGLGHVHDCREGKGC